MKLSEIKNSARGQNVTGVGTLALSLKGCAIQVQSIFRISKTTMPRGVVIVQLDGRYPMCNKR